MRRVFICEKERRRQRRASRRRSAGTSNSVSASATRWSKEIEPTPPTLEGASADEVPILPPVEPAAAGVAAAPDTATAVDPPLALCVIVTTADLLPALRGWNAT